MGMATVICRDVKSQVTILGLVPYRRSTDRRPTSKSVTLGYVDNKTHKPVYNEKYIPFVRSHNLDPDTVLKDYIYRRNKNINIDFTDHLKMIIGEEFKNEQKTTNADDQITNIFDPKILTVNAPSLIDPALEGSDLALTVSSAKKCHYGSIMLLDFLSQKIGLDDMLSKVFKNRAEKIKVLAYFNILEHKPDMLCPFFINNYDVPLDPAELSSQRIFELLLQIKEKERLLFYNLWAQKINEIEYLALDSTTISTYSNLISKAAYGYNKQHEKLKQLNLCYIFGEESGLPVYSSIYNGSLHDVSTLVKTVKESAIVQGKCFKLVMDGGFYSKKNINNLLNSSNRADFIIGLPATTNDYKNLIEEFNYINENITYAFQFHGDTMFSASKRINFCNKYLYAHVFIDPRKNDKNRDSIVNDILLMYENARENPKDYIDNPDYQYALNFEVCPTSPTGYKVTRNNNAYQDFRCRDGWFVLLTNCEKNPIKTLEIYRNRDVVEKAFDIIKNFMKTKRTYVHSDDVYESKAFIGFLSMILISMIHKVMKENKIYNDKTMDEFLSEMSSIKKVIFSDKSCVIDPIPRSIKNYLDFFTCPYPEN
jgi:hypothetical protein